MKGIFGPAISNDKTKVVVKSISGIKTKCMRSHIIPTVELDPEIIVLHCGTNDLIRDEQPTSIANEIIELALSIKKSNNHIVVSGIVPRNDQLKEKGITTNDVLESLCNQRNLPFVNHDNINPAYHTTRKGLHLTSKGSKIVGANILNILNSLDE